MTAPAYQPATGSACEMTGPLRCPECTGLVALEVGLSSTLQKVFCPYCLFGLIVPDGGRPYGTILQPEKEVSAHA